MKKAEKRKIFGGSASIFGNRGGFTLIELLVFSAIFTVVAIAFIAILISITRVQVRESSNAEVNRQSQFIIHTIQRSIEESSLIDIDVDPQTGTKTTSTLILRMTKSGDDSDNFARTYIYTSSGIAYLKTNDNGVPEPLNTGRVKVDSLIFTKRHNPPGHDSVDINLSISYNTDNIQQKFAQVIKTSVARVSAATFDSNLIPASSSPLIIGTQSVKWSSINGTIYFKEDAASNLNVGINESNPTYKLDVSAPPNTYNVGGLKVVGTSTFAGNVGINTTNPLYSLDVRGGVRIAPIGPLPPSADCNNNTYGTFWVTTGAAYYVRVCLFEPLSGTFKWLYLWASTTLPY